MHLAIFEQRSVILEAKLGYTATRGGENETLGSNGNDTPLVAGGEVGMFCAIGDIGKFIARASGLFTCFILPIKSLRAGLEDFV